MLVNLALIALLAGGCWYALRRRVFDRQKQPGVSGVLEYRTPLAFDECLDALRDNGPQDEFAYTCTRERDGGFTLHLTLHQPTSQPLDTLYSLRLDSGRQTVVTLIFLRDAFGSPKPVFPQTLMDRFMLQKLRAVPAQGAGQSDIDP